MVLGLTPVLLRVLCFVGVKRGTLLYFHKSLVIIFSVARFVEEYDTYVSDCIGPYLSASAALGGAADEQVFAFVYWIVLNCTINNYNFLVASLMTINKNFILQPLFQGMQMHDRCTCKFV